MQHRLPELICGCTSYIRAAVINPLEYCLPLKMKYFAKYVLLKIELSR